MSEEVAWPPVSPKAALLSSPTGRKRYHEEMQRSPIKRSRTTPGLLDRLRAARADEDLLGGTNNGDNADEEDEETLKLQLAAIEAKLKLKKLQQNKAKTDGPVPSSSAGSTQPSEAVQVALSPTRRVVRPTEPRSPSRVLLGIDKGKTGADVSLKRVKSLNERTTAISRAASRMERSTSRISQLSSRSNAEAPAAKSFSERMSAIRDRDRAKDAKRNAVNGARSSTFSLDKAEMEGYRAIAEENRKLAPSPVVPLKGQSYTRAEVLRAKESIQSGSKLRRSRTTPDLSAGRPGSTGEQESSSQPDSTLWEEFSGISLSTRILPHSFLKRILPEDRFKIYTIPDLLRDVKSPEYEMPDDVGDYVVFGIVASKSGALDQKQKAEEQSVGAKDWERKWDDGSQNQKKFIAMTLTDLEWTVDLYLFGTAVPRYHRLTPGTVVAILNPSIMPPKKGKEDTGAFSLTLHDGDDTVLEIGTARELGHCNAIRKDGKECGQWVHVAKSEICEWHLNLQLRKAEQNRMGLNSGGNGIGSGLPGAKRPNNFAGKGSGLLPQKQAQRFDQFTGSSYYVTQSSRSEQGQTSQPFGISASRALDHDDPFISDAQRTRDKKAQLLKRKERHAQESQIAKQLGSMGSSGAGAEYMRHRTGTATKRDLGAESSNRMSAQAIKNNIMRSKSDAGTKRAADNVRLSPVKKTRFLTEKGIREAGRESLGVTNHDDDSDDLEFV
ncbi:uncharacterized protein HMPREF1541_03163 [Cyphellophora europaea CBS 101466]|uniref:Uncharacterized protein n=1 Tax=Cyphellophora europaea (strain CBS 101466) TaxID=1220924 RepID=W2RZK8_CYPE1|nr:uncharacterized protein HMPREF1541_03163 [Cyphellophora europaea CBS 101466]ETN41228.1 hypothetical protein HMPREF1541_03163 [Cyphellophora europaea CBS 101466]